ncbi:HAD family phosphatase [Bacillus sp. NEB1478]|uniref:HAD family hydrolase n=1 Tax=Bacillus sp. NEB1478 TaxID=3073816 RepID=UPI0028737153|nr:HAD family phosphatase [Bacillus sp. NEB1478]WNB93508.1 HAD family phosphatase [Bacillus sp. NEB1478]
MKIKAVCFDMDGVLVDTMPHHVEAWLHSFKEKGFHHEEIEFYLREGMPGKQTIQDIFDTFEVNAAEQEIEDIYKEKRKYFKKHAKYTFIKETISLLHYLKERNIPCCLVTGSRREFVDEVLKTLSFEFHYVISGDDVNHGKPLPEPYEKAMSHFSYNPSEWLVIENAPLGIESAKKAGALCLAVETTLSEKYLEAADVIVKPSMLLQIVKSLINE